MTAPQVLLRRNLTFHFGQAVTVVDGQQVVQEMEVAITPLSSPSSPSAQETYVGGTQEQTVLLNSTDNTAVFQLVPSNAPGLTEPVNYRVAWRQGGVSGATTFQDFSMPDQDIDWDQLADLGALISGDAYLQQSDLGVPGRVAMLNDQGQVVDSDGNPVSMPADVASVSGAVQAEAVARQQGDTQNYNLLQTAIATQANLTQAQATSYTDQQVETLTAEIGNETGARENADNTLQSNLNAAQSSLQSQITSMGTTVSGLTDEMPTKADLVNGYVPIDQIDPAVMTNWIPVANINAMLALNYPSQVQIGDAALTPTAIYVLLSDDPTQLSNWRLLNDVLSVNGYTGAVNLTAADVGAVSATNGSILMSQVTGLSTALSQLAAASTVTALQSQVNNIQNDTTLVHTTQGVIQDAVLPANIALISPQNNITTKTGQVIAIGEGSGVASVNGQTGVVNLAPSDIGALPANGTIAESQVTGLSTDLGNRVLTTDTRLSNARTPTSHAATHASGGSDPLTLAQTQVTGLSTALSANTNNISSLDTRVTTLEASGPGGYGAGTGIYFAASAPTGDFVDNVTLHSPFGYNPTNPNANVAGYYMDPAGAQASDVVWPVFTVAGVLNFMKWGQANAPDPYYGKASDVTTLQGQVAAKANQTDLTTLQTTVAGLATQASVTSLTNTVAAKANETELQSLQTTVAGLATTSSVTALSNTVASKANQSDMTTAQTNITALQAALPTKADLVGGYLKSTQIPTSIPQANIANLVAQLAHLNSTGQFDASALTNIAGIPALAMGSITGLTTAMAAKADLLSNGKLNPAQLPAIGITDVFSVTSQAAMLAVPAHQGDVCIITQGANIGSYILSTPDPTQLANWVELAFPTGVVSSVNGYTGTVVLGAADVGAMASNAVLPISQISGLQAQLNSFATSTALNSAVASLTTPAQVQAQLAASTPVKQVANFVATSAIPSLSGQQSIDGVLTPVGSVVLATAQSSSVNNGLWTVQTGAWTRTTDYATGAYFVRGSMVVVSQGTNYAKTLWQETAASGFVDTNASTWANIGSVAAPLTYTNGNGLSLTGQQFAVKPATGGGLTVSTGGVGVDPTSVARKATGTIPGGGGTVFTLTHNLNVTTPVQVIIEDTITGNLVGIGATVLSPNSVSVEFGTAPSTNQYNWTVLG